MQKQSIVRLLAPAFPAMVAASLACAAAPPEGSLLTPDQLRTDRIALTLLKDPGVEAARAAGLKQWSTLPAYALKDGKSTLEGAVAEAEYAALRSVAAYEPGSPLVIWASAPPYSYDQVNVPGSRYAGDNPDRIYRSVAVDPSHRYEIHGRRATRPSNDDFLFEAISGPALGLIGTPVASLKARDIDIAADGSFTVTVDASPANGRRNHLTLPSGTTGILLRDTLADWSAQRPNDIVVRRVDSGTVAERSQEDLQRQAAQEVTRFFDANTRFLDQVTKAPLNHPVAQVRRPQDGVAGAIAASSRFSVKADEALVITIDPAGAKYVGFQLTDPWFRSRPYWSTTGSLSNQQVKANADGSLTYLIAAHDPGYYNWLSTSGLHEGLLLIRIEDFAQTPDPAKVIREAKVVKLAQLGAALPADAARVGPGERVQQLNARHAGYLNRVARPTPAGSP